MIGVDTNVLVRLFVLDDPQQHSLAVAFFEQRTPEDPAFVSVVVLAELVWVLGRAFAYPPAQIMEIVAAMLDTPDFVVEKPDVVRTAMAVASENGAGFADALISAVALDARCRSTVTFDRHAARAIAAMELLA